MVRLRYEAKISMSYLLEGLKSLLFVKEPMTPPPHSLRPQRGPDPAPPPRTLIHHEERSLHIHWVVVVVVVVLFKSMAAPTWLEQHR